MTLQRKSAGGEENWLKNSQRDNNSFSLNALLTKYQGDCRFQIQLYPEIMFWVSKQKYKIKMASKLPFNRISNQNGSKKSRFVFIFGIELSSQPLWRTRAEESEQNWTAWMFNGRHYVFGTLTMEWWAVNLG